MFWLSISYVPDESLLVEEIGRLFDVCTETGTALAVGGQALDERLRKRLRYTTFGNTMQHLEQFAELLTAAALLLTASVSQAGNCPQSASRTIRVSHQVKEKQRAADTRRLRRRATGEPPC